MRTNKTGFRYFEKVSGGDAEFGTVSLDRRRLPLHGRSAAGRGLFCAKPFEHFEIQHNGRAYLCCPSWLPESVGDVTEQGPLQLWNGDAAKRIRESILDGSFRYCSACPHLASKTGNGIVRRISHVTEPEHLAIIRERRLTMERIAWLNLAYDRSCNLSCPSCRLEVVVATGEPLERLQAFQKAFVTRELLASIDRLYVTGSGDPFASKLFRDLLRGLDAADYPKLTVALHTNALLFTPQNWQAMKAAQPLIRYVEISIDAATPATYSVNRRGGDWQRLLENLRFIAGLRREGPLQFIKLSFVVQANNWREMPAFVRLASSHAADLVQFMPLFNWGTFDDEEYARRAVHLPDHPEHGPFADLLACEPELRHSWVIHGDFGSAVTPMEWQPWHG